MPVSMTSTVGSWRAFVVEFIRVPFVVEGPRLPPGPLTLWGLLSGPSREAVEFARRDSEESSDTDGLEFAGVDESIDDAG